MFTCPWLYNYYVHEVWYFTLCVHVLVCYVCKCVCVCVCVCVCMCMYVCVIVLVCMCACARMCEHVYVCACSACVCDCVWLYMCVRAWVLKNCATLMPDWNSTCKDINCSHMHNINHIELSLISSFKGLSFCSEISSG